jgi:hypothetical protein
MPPKPKWLLVTDKLLSDWKLFQIGIDYFDNRIAAAVVQNKTDERAVPKFALFHFGQSLEISMYANEKGRHAIAISIIRHCVEALTLIDIGLQEVSYSDSLFVSWIANKKSHGELRASLQKHVWQRYSGGLWNESWADFFKNLSQAVQPYAHYTNDLRQWQYKVLSSGAADLSNNTFNVEIGPFTYDPLKASRITLLHCLLIWALGRLFQENKVPLEDPIGNLIGELGISLSNSKLLFPNTDWGVQLYGTMIFKS